MACEICIFIKNVLSLQKNKKIVVNMLAKKGKKG